MRNLKVVLAALALGVSSAALAEGAGPANQTVSLTNGIVDTIAVAGTPVVNITALATEFTSTGSPTLAYSTHSDDHANTTTNAAQTRKVTVSSTTIPFVTGKVNYAGTNGTVATGGVTLGNSVNLVTAIPRFITQGAAALTYTFSASQGFTSGTITVTYTLVDE